MFRLLTVRHPIKHNPILEDGWTSIIVFDTSNSLAVNLMYLNKKMFRFNLNKDSGKILLLGNRES